MSLFYTACIYCSDGYIAPVKLLSEEECDLLLKDYQTFLVRK